MSGKKGMQGSGGRRPGAGKPPSRHIARRGSRYTIEGQPGAWTVTHADSAGITLTNEAGDALTLRTAA